jgi:hypothetical protein
MIFTFAVLGWLGLTALGISGIVAFAGDGRPRQRPLPSPAAGERSLAWEAVPSCGALQGCD